MNKTIEKCDEILNKHLVELASQGNKGAIHLLKLRGYPEDERSGKDYGIWYDHFGGIKEHDS